MAGYSSPGGGGFDYVQPGEPNNPQLGDLWFDTDAGSDGSGEAKVYDSTGWVVTGYASHTDLMDIGADDHHSPVTVSAPLTENGTQGLGLSIGDGVTLSGGALVAALSTGLTIDGGGNVRVAPEGITNALIEADAVDTGELAAGSVGSSQIQAGAVRHGTEADTPSDAHHTRYSDAEASAAAPVQSVGGQTGDVTISPTQQSASFSNSLDYEQTEFHGPLDFTPIYINISSNNSLVVRLLGSENHKLMANEDNYNGVAPVLFDTIKVTSVELFGPSNYDITIHGFKL